MKQATVAVFVTAVVLVSAIMIFMYSPTFGTVASDIPPSIAKTNNDFTFDFYRQISDNNKNIFFSPPSIFVAFSMLYEGAKENTAEQMIQVFGFEPDVSTRHDLIRSSLAFLNQNHENATLEMANSIWLAEWFVPYNPYVDTVRNVYRSIIENVNFTDNGVDKINLWASEKTHKKVTKVLEPSDVDKFTAMALVNTIYFKGTWESQFPVEDTSANTFWTSSSKKVETDFMRNTNEFRYLATENAKILELPYKGEQFSMLIALPNSRDGIVSMGTELSTKLIKQWQENMDFHEVFVEIPKFKMAQTYDLKKPLENLGMTDIFNKTASDLSGITDVEVDDLRLFVTKAAQQSYIEVNEEGTEAAAATTIVAGIDSGPAHFNANHPFLFFIQDDASGTILFMGRMYDPTS